LPVPDEWGVAVQTTPIRVRSHEQPDDAVRHVRVAPAFTTADLVAVLSVAVVILSVALATVAGGASTALTAPMATAVAVRPGYTTLLRAFGSSLGGGVPVISASRCESTGSARRSRSPHSPQRSRSRCGRSRSWPRAQRSGPHLRT
jgi:uncharacterized membrane protein YgcG